MAAKIEGVEALVFDVFGTVVDWRGSIVRLGRAWSRTHGRAIDWPAVADEWRAGYAPTMDRIRRGEMPWTRFDTFNRRLFAQIVRNRRIRGLGVRDIDEINGFWRRLSPWPDAVRGLGRLKRRFVLSTLSNGDVRLLADMAKNAGLPWDLVLSSELFRHYKPDPEVYRGAVQLLGGRPGAVMMVAAHKHDLRAAKRCGLRTALVHRPREFGGLKTADRGPERYIDLVAEDFADLATKLGS